MKIPVYNMQGEQVREIELSPFIYEIEPNVSVMPKGDWACTAGVAPCAALGWWWCGVWPQAAQVHQGYAQENAPLGDSFGLGNQGAGWQNRGG